MSRICGYEHRLAHYDTLSGPCEGNFLPQNFNIAFLFSLAKGWVSKRWPVFLRLGEVS